MKYEITDIVHPNNPKLKRIRALKDFSDVKKGDYGGWVESEKNLSQDGTCWVYDNAKVFGDARVYGHSKVYDNSMVGDNAQVYDNAMVGDNAQIFDNAWVGDNAQIFGDARITGDAVIH